MENIGKSGGKFLPRDNPELQKVIEQRQEKMRQDAILGKKEIDFINLNFDRFWENGIRTETSVKEMDLAFEELKLKLVQILLGIQNLENDPLKKTYLDEIKIYLKDILTSSGEGKRILQILPEKNGEIFGIADFVNYLTQNDCQKFLYEFFNGHIKRMETFQANLDKISEEAKKTFVERISQGVEVGEIPKEVLKRLELVEKSPVNVFDFFKSVEEGYIFYQRRIAVAKIPDGVEIRLYRFALGELGYEEREFAESILYHEFFHIIAGAVQYFDRASKSLETIKSGMHIANKYIWLNEAITEFLRVNYFPTEKQFRLRNVNGSEIYIEERKKFHEIFGRSFFSKNIRNIINAYFEDVDDTVPVKDRFKFFRVLKNHVNRYGREKYDKKNYFRYLDYFFATKKSLENLLSNPRMSKYFPVEFTPPTNKLRKIFFIKVYPHPFEIDLADLHFDFFVTVPIHQFENEERELDINLHRLLPKGSKFVKKIYTE